jgi:hypothetical protein
MAGRAIETHSRPMKKRCKRIKSDRRRGMDADSGKKQYEGKNKDGTLCIALGLPDT